MLAAESERLTAQARFIIEKIDGVIVIGMKFCEQFIIAFRKSLRPLEFFKLYYIMFSTRRNSARGTEYFVVFFLA